LWVIESFTGRLRSTVDEDSEIKIDNIRQLSKDAQTAEFEYRQSRFQGGHQGLMSLLFFRRVQPRRGSMPMPMDEIAPISREFGFGFQQHCSLML
jgi:hypothetical protein